MEKKIRKIANNLNPMQLPEILRYLLKDEATGGRLIILAAVLALLIANSPLFAAYNNFWHTQLNVGIGDWALSMDLRHWVNEGLMAIFFLVVGLEIKRELVEGQLREKGAAILPAFAALGGMVVPAVIYILLNVNSPFTTGWAIPMATDIAFVLAILALLGRRVPRELKLFLLTLAIVDDIGAVVVIALFYGSGVTLPYLGVAFGLVGLILLLNKLRRMNMLTFVLLAPLVWLAFHEAGIHASIAGALLGFLAPFHGGSHDHGIAGKLEYHMIPVSTFVAVPIFAFANTGVELTTDGFSPYYGPVIWGIIAGLIVGKVFGIMFFSWIATRLFQFAELPNNVSWRHMLGAGLLAGVGFTVSIFVTELAFTDRELIDVAKLSIFVASLASAVGGVLVLRFFAKRKISPETA